MRWAHPASARFWSKTLLCLAVVFGLLQPCVADVLQWYKGNTHSHTAWSDGKELPELAADWYKSHGYDFFVMSDHNVMLTGNLYRANDGSSFPTTSPDAAEAKFGPGWVTYEESTGKVKLKTFAEISAKLNAPGEFLLIPGEEITTSVGGKAVHLNAVNLVNKITPIVGANVAETLNLNLAAVAAQAAALGRPILSHINHPNWNSYSISPEDVAQAVDTRFFEVLNAHSAGINHYGDATHPGTERMWDIVNTIRMVNLKMLPMFGLAVDDTHSYTPGSGNAKPGRGWIAVRAAALTPQALLDSMIQGDFYASSGVVLNRLDFDTTAGTLDVTVEPKAGVTYTIDFIGTPVGTDPAKQGDGTYSAEIGKVLKSVVGTAASYTLTGDELYVRAHVRSTQPMENPASGSVQWEEAWTQPVGAWQVVPEPSTCAVAAGAAAVAALGWRHRRRVTH